MRPPRSVELRPWKRDKGQLLWQLGTEACSLSILDAGELAVISTRKKLVFIYSTNMIVGDTALDAYVCGDRRWPKRVAQVKALDAGASGTEFDPDAMYELMLRKDHSYATSMLLTMALHVLTNHEVVALHRSDQRFRTFRAQQEAAAFSLLSEIKDWSDFVDAFIPLRQIRESSRELRDRVDDVSEPILRQIQGSRVARLKDATGLTFQALAALPSRSRRGRGRLLAEAGIFRSSPETVGFEDELLVKPPRDVGERLVQEYIYDSGREVAASRLEVFLKVLEAVRGNRTRAAALLWKPRDDGGQHPEVGKWVFWMTEYLARQGDERFDGWARKKQGRRPSLSDPTVEVARDALTKANVPLYIFGWAGAPEPQSTPDEIPI